MPHRFPHANSRGDSVADSFLIAGPTRPARVIDQSLTGPRDMMTPPVGPNPSPATAARGTPVVQAVISRYAAVPDRPPTVTAPAADRAPGRRDPALLRLATGNFGCRVPAAHQHDVGDIPRYDAGVVFMS